MRLLFILLILFIPFEVSAKCTVTLPRLSNDVGSADYTKSGTSVKVEAGKTVTYCLVHYFDQDSKRVFNVSSSSDKQHTLKLLTPLGTEKFSTGTSNTVQFGVDGPYEISVTPVETATISIVADIPPGIQKTCLKPMEARASNVLVMQIRMPIGAPDPNRNCSASPSPTPAPVQ
jgi:hypothetical protein